MQTTDEFQTYANLQKNPELARTQEFWEDIPPELQMSQYQVSTFGDVFNKIRNFPVTPQVDAKGRTKVRIVLDDDTSTVTALDHIIATTFIPNPEHRNTIGHINGRLEDNNVSNLQWIEGGRIKKTPRRILQYDENENFLQEWESVKAASDYLRNVLEVDSSEDTVMNGIQKAARNKAARRTMGYAYGFLWMYAINVEIPDEEWRPIPTIVDVAISNTGRAKRISNNRPFQGTVTGDGSRLFSIDGIAYSAARLVASAFLGLNLADSNICVVHKNNKKRDNIVENLELVPRAEVIGRIAAITGKKKKPKGKEVLKYDITGQNLLAEYATILEAVAANNLKKLALKNACNNGVALEGHMWKWKYPPNIPNFTPDQVMPMPMPLPIQALTPVQMPSPAMNIAPMPVPVLTYVMKPLPLNFPPPPMFNLPLPVPVLVPLTNGQVTDPK